MSKSVALQRTPAQERIAEICEILAAGLMRMRRPKSTGQIDREANFEVGFHQEQSGVVSEPEFGETP